MVLRLAEALEGALRERNALLLAAGYAPFYRQTGLDAPQMEAVRQAVDLLLRQQEPYPAILTDRYWNTLRMNAGTRSFWARFPICDSVQPQNGVRLVFIPRGSGHSSRIGRASQHASFSGSIVRLLRIRLTKP